MPVRFTVSGSQEVGLQLRALAGLIGGGTEKAVTSATRKIQARVVRNASTGRHPPGEGHIPGTGPGPNIATGRYINSIRAQVVTRATATFGAAVSGTVWTDAPQGPRLEYGFVGPDSLGRTFRYQPFPHWGPAIDSVEPEFLAELDALIDAAVRGV